MKRLLIIFFSFCCLIANAQQYNNEWIDYSKTYYKFKIGSTGLHRISQASLTAIGLGTTNAADFQLWRNGREVPVYTSSQTGALATNGYLEFWAEANDGRPDSTLYRQPQDQINNTKSLFTDTASYFLTVNPAGGNKRLVPTANTPNGAPAETYFMHTRTIAFNEALHLGRPEGVSTAILYTSSYEQGKGWVSNDIANGQTRNVTEDLKAFVGAGAPQVQVNMNVVGNFNALRNVKLTINGNDVFDEQLIFYNYSRLSKTVPATLLTGANESINITNQAATLDRIRVAVVELSYPRLFKFGGASSFRFRLPASSSGRYLEISEFSFSGVPVLYDLSNGRRYQVDASNPALLKVYLPASAVIQDLVLVNPDASNVKNVTTFETRNFINYLLPANQGDYLMVTHNAILSGGNGTQPVEEYRAYRSSANGGGYNAKIYLVDQLIDQFGFGIKNNPAGVRNFSRWARDKFSVAPKQMFIIGKGVTYYLSRIYESQYHNEITKLNLIPTMGHPGSDVLLTSQGGSSVPLTPVGRISVVNGDELLTYLSKIKQYEQHLRSTSPVIAESAWKKNVIHMVGANDQQTIDLLYRLLNFHKIIIEDTLYGANVTDYVKSYSGAVQQLTTERLANQINSGVGMLTYFGHSSATTLGFDMDDPMNYNNQGKYPLFNMMGCSVGDIFGLNGARIAGPDVLSEKYVLAKDRGGIGMMAGTSFGYVSTLDLYNNRFYRLLATTFYGKTVGEQMQGTIRKVFETGGELDQLQRSQCEEYALNGDPAVRLYQFDKPDYAIEDPLVSISPSFISVAEPDFKIDAKIMNLGKAIDDSVVIEITRTYPNQLAAVVKRDTIPGIRYIDSVLYTLPIDPVNDKGLNKITITIDPSNAIEELYETNNSVTKEIFIFEDELRPVYPYNFAIVNKQGVKFAASTANPLAETRNYLFEIDTTELFNSPFKISQTKTSPGGLIEFSPSITFKDSTVYYWRVASEPEANTQAKWNLFSFIYINGEETGFNQSHYYQFLKNEMDEIHLDQNRMFQFDQLNSAVGVKTAIYGYAVGASDFAVTVNDQPKQTGFISPLSAQANSLRFYLVNNKTMEVVYNVSVSDTKGKYGSYAPIPFNSFSIPGFFQFDISTTEARTTVMNFFDSIPDHYYVAIANPNFDGMPLPEQWKSDTSVLGTNKSLYHKFIEAGLDQIDQLTSFMPFVFIFQKGNPIPIKQVVGPLVSSVLNISAAVKTSGNSGYMLSENFGPAKSWKSLKWDGYSMEQPSDDNARVSVIGISNNGEESVLMRDIALSSRNEMDISSISAQQYPYIKLRMRNVDSTNFTPYQLRYWRAYYDPVPEGAIAPNTYFSFKDTLELGEPLNFGVAFKNVSSYNFDSMKVKLTIRDRNNSENAIAVPLQKNLVAGDTIRLSMPLASNQFVGSNSLFVEFNPDNHQPEQYHFNNFLYKDFFVKSDTVSPFLDVTFDGVHILNKDIVSSKPDILIKLTDDARWLLLNSTDIFKVQLRFPDGSLRDYAFNNDTLQFTPASGAENVATVNFRPYLGEDGAYELLITAKDQSGNTAGGMQYRVAFQVINKPMISNLLNYPNPFTTSTAFVFTLTGSEVPQNLRIQIMTITGKIVKEITKNELGAIKIGRNITEYKWDGTDQFGQKLANGVYLYRVITNLNGKSLDKYTAPGDNTDKYFNKGYGKMYLMR